MKTTINLVKDALLKWPFYFIFLLSLIISSCETGEPIVPEDENGRRIVGFEEEYTDDGNYECDGEMGEWLCQYIDVEAVVYGEINDGIEPIYDFSDSLDRNNLLIDIYLPMEEMELTPPTDPDCGHNIIFSSSIDHIELLAIDAATEDTVDLAPHVVYIDYNYEAQRSYTLEELLDVREFEDWESYFSFELTNEEVLPESTIFYVEVLMKSEEVFDFTSPVILFKSE